MAKKTHCKRGHPRTPENVRTSGHCRLCTSIYMKKWHVAHPTYSRTWFEDHLSKAMLNNARKRARKKGVAFSIEESDIHIPELCPIFGFRLEIGLGRSIPTSPTLDRIVSTKGYVKGNIRVISQKANQIKSCATPEEIMKVATFMQETK